MAAGYRYETETVADFTRRDRMPAMGGEAASTDIPETPSVAADDLLPDTYNIAHSPRQSSGRNPDDSLFPFALPHQMRQRAPEPGPGKPVGAAICHRPPSNALPLESRSHVIAEFNRIANINRSWFPCAEPPRSMRIGASRTSGTSGLYGVVVPAAVAATPAQPLLALAEHGVRLSAAARW